MLNDYIAILDSGIGGFSLLKDLVKYLPNERYLYFGDNYNAPYGNRTERDLINITMENIEKIKSFGVKCIVFGCNTLSVCVLSKIQQYEKIKLFGVFPPVEKAILDGNKTLLLATENTVNEYKDNKNVISVGLPTLAKEIEDNKFHLDYIDLDNILNSAFNLCNVSKYNVKNYFDNVILGCTHYFFVKNKIYNHFLPQKMISGSLNSVLRLKKYLKSVKSLGNNKQFSIKFIGDCAKENQYFYKKVVSKLNF
ncbi:MAG: aspartate/glutamate racemase family protein [Clostridia bacterium]|nr:aspartate/glutamate racemase family protein [Clostridia bacterium]